MRNYTLLGKRRIDLELSISYSDNMQNVEGIVITAINKIDILPSTEVEFFYTKFGDFGIHLVVRYWIKFSRQAAYMKAVSDGMKNIKTAFDENDIVIPFPIRTLDFGVNGGKHLSQVLDNRSNDGKTPTD
jgi:small conductance mechanosensitive channel